ncbi:hypothetical protein GE321_00610 [Shigella sonnei]|nr:hypothetical protein [Shigella sonnei]WJJ57341.1 hypothetical protein [Escherichia phage 4E8]
MKCFKCESTLLHLDSKVIRELAKGSPTKGKNKKFVEIKVIGIHCSECKSCSFLYEEHGGRK